jgi:hypothetical protein
VAYSAGATIGVGLVGFAAQWLFLGDTLRVQDVQLVGVQVTDPHALASAAAVTGQSLLTLDPSAVASRVAEVPGVRAVTVRRDWPRGVVIDVTEAQGWGYWQQANQRVVVDVDGQPLALGRPPAANAPTVLELGATGQVAPDADTVRLVNRLMTDGTFDVLRVRPSGFVFRRDRGLTVMVQDGPDAIFGDSHSFEFKVATWGALLDRIERQRMTSVREIDLRFGKHVVMR